MKKKKIMLGPVITMIVLIFVIAIASFILSLFGSSTEITQINAGALETSEVSVKSIFSLDGIKYLISSPVKTFRAFEPLVLIIISLMAISIGKASGLFKAIFTRFRRVKPGVITFLTLFLGIISSFFGQYGYVILLPLIAVIYQYIGRNSVLGILTCFIGITMGYGAGLVFNYDDYALGLLTKAAASASLDKNYLFNAWSSSYIMIASTFILTIVGTFIIESFLKPKIKEDIKEEDELKYSSKGLVLSNIAFLIIMLIFIYMIIPGLPGSGILLDKSEHSYVAMVFGGKALFNDAFIFIFLITMMVCSGIYGSISGNIKDSNDYSVGLSKEFDNLGYIFVLMFFVSILSGIIDFTNIGKVVGAALINLVSNFEFTGVPLVILIFLVTIIMSFLIPDLLTKWQIASPILVPLCMKANMTPDFIQFIFKAGDSVGKCLTPFFVYYVIMLAFLEKYNSRESVKITVFGTLKSLMPTILIFACTWLLILVGWYLIGIPLGAGTFPTM